MSGTPSGARRTQFAATTVSSANAATFRPGWRSLPSSERWAYTEPAPVSASAHSHTSPQRAGVAPSARGRPVEDDPVAGRDMGDALADGDDGAGALVAEHAAGADPHRAVGQGQVGVADPGGGEPDPDLAGAGLGQVDLGDLQGRADGGQYSGTDHEARSS